jgi:nitrogen fixation NifU-like protein
MEEKPREIYSKEVMEIWKNPKNFGKIENPTHEFSEVNNLCGDDMSVQMIVENGVIEEIKFISSGCLVCIVFGSELTEKVKGMKVEDVKKMTNEDLLKLLNVKIHPAKLYCAGLSLDAIQGSLEKNKSKE